ncbi:hypothetical protein [Shewanella sp. KT0246]|uniref:hypothetical protein n=1 Tax=Shewanella sp. KT0246 TaxID=2815912 RepID=UPI001BC774C2|nr:hypothetical protein [Shewanella sp. KT0246]GIU52045.1 hypothetical protein TUM4249_19790 [Shewanella sp. KT0246]
MSKIVTAINAMISNPELITDSIQGCEDGEQFFVYDKKHSWSITSNESGKFYLHYYPGSPDVYYLANIAGQHWHQEEVKMVTYNSDILGTQEALSSMKELQSIVSEKVYGMDDVLEDIIKKGQL